MPPAAFRVIAVAVLAAASASAFQSSPVNRPWPPDVEKVPDESPALSPQDALQTFYMPPGFRVELVASEPLVQEPVAIDWDLDGRLWVVEMPGYMRDMAAAGELDPVGRVVVLQDENGDGRMDTRTIFADGLVLARSIKVLDRGVLIGEPPNVWLMRDTDGDLRSDSKTLITDRYGGRGMDPQNNANGFYWAIDNTMHTAGQADVQFRSKNGTIEVQRTLPRGQWGVSQDDTGRIFRNQNESALHVDVIPTAYYARNPILLRTRGSYERLASLDEDLNIVWPVRPNPGTNRAYQTGIDRADGTLAKFTAVCAPLVYRGDRLPSALAGDVFVAEPAANLVSRLVLEDDGMALRAKKAYPRGEFLASTDERFRPVYLSDAPDGTLYVVDLYRGVIEHRISITEYLRDQILARKLERPLGFGRIYRVVHESTRRDTSRLADDGAPQLVAMLSHPNGWRRDTAQRLLVERGERSAVASLLPLARDARDWRTRLHALWTLDGLDAVEPPLVEAALQDSSPAVRAAAIRIAERWLGEVNHPIARAVLDRLDDRDWTVRRQLAASIGVLPAAARETAAASLLERYDDDPVTVDAVLSGLRGSEHAVLESLTASAAPVRAQASIAVLTATIVRSAREENIRSVLASIADERVIDPLIGALANSDWIVRMHATKALGRIKAAGAIDPLIPLLQDKVKAVREEATVALAKIGDAALSSLLDALKHPEWLVRLHAVEALARMRSPRAVEPLLWVLFNDTDQAIREDVIRALGQIGDSRATEFLMTAMKEPRLRTLAVESLGQIGDRSAVPLLVAVLEGADRLEGLRPVAGCGDRWDEEMVTKGAAVRALGSIGDDTAIPALLKALDQTETRADAAAALVKFGSKVIAPLLTIMTQSSDENVRFHVKDTLAQVGWRAGRI